MKKILFAMLVLGLLAPAAFSQKPSQDATNTTDPLRNLTPFNPDDYKHLKPANVKIMRVGPQGEQARIMTDAERKLAITNDELDIKAREVIQAKYKTVTEDKTVQDFLTMAFHSKQFQGMKASLGRKLTACDKLVVNGFKITAAELIDKKNINGVVMEVKSACAGKEDIIKYEAFPRSNPIILGIVQNNIARDLLTLAFYNKGNFKNMEADLKTMFEEGGLQITDAKLIDREDNKVEIELTFFVNEKETVKSYLD